MRSFYSAEELFALTGCKKPKEQIAWLRNSDYRFIVNAAGKPVVFKTQVKRDDVDDGLLTARQINNRAIPIKAVIGIYFLLSGSEVIYIGQSINLIERIGNHLRNSNMSFDSYSFVEANESDLNELELKYIKKYRPRMNQAGLIGAPKYRLCGEEIID